MLNLISINWATRNQIHWKSYIKFYWFELFLFVYLIVPCRPYSASCSCCFLSRIEFPLIHTSPSGLLVGIWLVILSLWLILHNLLCFLFWIWFPFSILLLGGSRFWLYNQLVPNWRWVSLVLSFVHCSF